MLSPFYKDKIYYLIGDPLKPADLKSAKLTDNIVVII